LDFRYYTVRTRATDSVGNVESPSGGVTFYFNSGNTIIPKKKSGGCCLSEAEGCEYSALFVAGLLLILYAASRRKRLSTG
jgi:hypothetical protein